MLIWIAAGLGLGLVVVGASDTRRGLPVLLIGVAVLLLAGAFSVTTPITDCFIDWDGHGNPLSCD